MGSRKGYWCRPGYHEVKKADLVVRLEVVGRAEQHECVRRRGGVRAYWASPAANEEGAQVREDRGPG